MIYINKDLQTNMAYNKTLLCDSYFCYKLCRCRRTAQCRCQS